MLLLFMSLVSEYFLGGVLLVSVCAVHAASGTHYFDAAATRVIMPDPNWVAEIRSTPVAGQAQAKSIGAAQPSAFVTLRRVNQSTARSMDGVVTSPVYREGNSPAGRLMALPGGVLLKMHIDWDADRVSKWAATKGFSIAPRANIKGNWYFISTVAGNPALDLANALQESGEVIFASPNWWKQTEPR